MRASNVFLDTAVFIEANFSYKSPRLASLSELARTGRIRVFLTEITLREIKANLKEAVERAVRARPSPILRNSSIPKVRALFERPDATEVESELLGQLEDFIRAANIEVLPIAQDSLDPVLDRYFCCLPPFSAGKNKAEFPDALTLETLTAWCLAEGSGMSVISRDEGVKAACSPEGPLYSFEDLPKYLDEVASEDVALSNFIRETILLHDAEIFKEARRIFPNLGFYLIDLEGDVADVELVDIEYDGEVEIISVTEYEAILEIPATLTFSAGISYYVPGTGSYDSEEGVLLFQDTGDGIVTRTARRSIGVAVSFEDLNPESFELNDVWFEGTKDIAVHSDYAEDWPYK